MKVVVVVIYNEFAHSPHFAVHWCMTVMAERWPLAQLTAVDPLWWWPLGEGIQERR